MNFLSFSAEAQDPAGYFSMKIVQPIKLRFNQDYGEKRYCDELDSIFIVFICMSEELKQQVKYSERKRIFWKRRYADFRLELAFEEFLQACPAQRLSMLWDVIDRALKLIAQRVPSLKYDELVEDLKPYFEN